MNLFAAALAPLLLMSTPVRADSTPVYCRVSPHDHTIPAQPFGPCMFSQYEGNIYLIDSGRQHFEFLDKDQGVTHRRQGSSEGIGIHVEGEYSLNILWTSPGAPYPVY